MTHTAGDGGGLLCDMREFLGAWALVHGGIGNKHGMRFADHDVNTKGDRILFWVKHAAQFAQRLAKGAGDAGDHCIGLTHL